MQPYLVPIDLSPLAESFNDLPLDKYTPEGYRSRRLSHVTMFDDGELKRHCGSEILQSSSINGHAGDILRYYFKLDDKTFMHPTFRRMVRLFQGITGWTSDIHVHQIRITAYTDGSPTPVAPEGPHSDGYAFTMPFVVGHTNVSGGVFEVYGDNKILLSGRAANHCAVFDDSDHLHYATPIELIDRSMPGYWDTFVITTGV